MSRAAESAAPAKHDSMSSSVIDPGDGLPVCTIVNVVSTYSLGVCLNLKKIATYMRDIPVKFNPSRFAAMTLYIQFGDGETTTVLCFASGNVVHTGAHTEEKARLHAHMLVYFFNVVLGINARLEDFEITNIVSECRVPFEVDLHKLQEILGSKCNYEPLNFPAAIVPRSDDPKKVALVYMSGGIVLTGSKDREDILKIRKEIYEHCSRARYTPYGDVSKSEIRFKKMREKNTKENLNKISKNIRKMTEKVVQASNIEVKAPTDFKKRRMNTNPTKQQQQQTNTVTTGADVVTHTGDDATVSIIKSIYGDIMKGEKTGKLFKRMVNPLNPLFLPIAV